VKLILCSSRDDPWWADTALCADGSIRLVSVDARSIGGNFGASSCLSIVLSQQRATDSTGDGWAAGPPDLFPECLCLMIALVQPAYRYTDLPQAEIRSGRVSTKRQITYGRPSKRAGFGTSHCREPRARRANVFGLAISARMPAQGTVSLAPYRLKAPLSGWRKKNPEFGGSGS